MPSFAKLIEAYLNEKACKMLLPYNCIADEFLGYLQNEDASSMGSDIIRSLKELERERIQFFVKEYILVRIEKINANLYLETSLLNASERIYYSKIKSALENYIDIPVGPSKDGRDEYIAFRCIKKMENVKIDGEVINIAEGSFVIANIKEVIDFLVPGFIVLV
ncbi:GINS complex subunit 4 [Enteropsectra breve]|nr:GINS complex subunit 4 [Enteropsectra breve]